ncbi:glutamine synthetase [Chitinivorax tropicus]|uniref:Glutamine synthetase n=1 Tax=Chitinivorax tropicus TaxID=714531 RepID=A0A840MUA5_9PROT|nr:glutamine synthetase family protein [Chitinivorax tropicus]MBB5019903.1 glutamine synthetase [Chitinivorax tropicus]
MESINEFFREHRITEVECVIPDMTGIARGKILPKSQFSSGEKMRLPTAVLIQTVTGDYPDDDSITGPTDPDMVCVPDASTVTLVPWAEDPTALVIHDCVHFDGSPVEISPRHVLRRMIDLFGQRGWKPVVAPELEFYLIERNTDPNEPLRPPIGRTGRPETGRQSYSIDAVNEFDPFFEDVYDYCDAMQLDIDTLIHEVGAAQMEINFLHGDALDLADRVFLFKRVVRETAFRHNIYATFMAKPMQDEPGSAMHVHQSVVDAQTGQNVFSNADGSPSDLFLSYVAGLQTYMPAVMPIMAPYVNSYRRLSRHTAAPINLQWGYDNRTVGMRVPNSSPDSRRVENRVAGVDVNPYLAMAATLACGYLGMVQGLRPKPPMSTSAYDLDYELPRHLEDAVEVMRDSKDIGKVLGESFVHAYCSVKEKEFDTYFRVISSWERKHLLLHV